MFVPRASGWENVKRSFFNGEVFRETFPDLLDAFWLDVKIFVWSAPCIFVLALAIAVARNTRNPALFPLRLFSAGYVDVFRGIPVILTIYLIGFGVPGLGIERPWNSPLLWGSVALILAYSAYVSEVFRAGIESVHESQRAAARSLGMSSGQTMRHVVLPQAVRRVAPPLLNDLVALQKDVGLISLAGPIDAIRVAQIQTAETYNYTPYVVAGALFVLMAIPLIAVTDWVTLRAARRQSAEGSA